jgi:hypothetical protein
MRRFRGVLILGYLTLWLIFAGLLVSARLPRSADGLGLFLAPMSLAATTALSIAAVPVFQLFSIAVAGLLYRMRLSMLIIVIASPVLGSAAAIAFLRAVIVLASGIVS